MDYKKQEYFNSKIDKYKEKSEKEILDFLSTFWNVSPSTDGVIKLYASYQKSEHKDNKGNDFAFFVDVRNETGDILYYPYNLGKVKIWSQYRDSYETQTIWQINVQLSEKKFRKENPFALSMANYTVGKPSLKFIDRLEKEDIIKKIFKDTGYTTRDANNTVNALHNIMDDLYTNADDRFVYELLQNADDQPQEGKNVSVFMQLLENHLLFMHNGRPFSNDDVDSICSIGSSTKRNFKEKIGYKGIGFKSVFTGSDTVIVNSGNFSFAFDKHSPIYNEEDIEKVPWQLKPIWQEKYRYPLEVRNNEYFWKSQVGISLDVDREKVEQYDRSILKILSNPIFLLFLKNVDSFHFKYGEEDLMISKIKDCNSVDIKRNDKVISSWMTSDFVVEIPMDIRDAMQNDRNVPQKMKEATKTQISIAVNIANGQVSDVVNSILYAYLPTTVSDFKFNFIVNADFLLTANREQLHTKKVWNQFLFQQIGGLLIECCKLISSHTSTYLKILPLKKLPEEETGHLALSTYFNSAYKSALESEPFILNHKGELARQNEIIIDKTGLSEIVGADVFCQLIETKKHLPSDKIDGKILEEDIFENIENLKFDNVIDAITNNSDFNDWYLSASDEQKNKLYKWIEYNNIKTRERKMKPFVSNLPLFQFGEDHKSYEEIDSSDHLITTEHISSIRDILSKLGFICSDNIFEENHPLYEFIDLQDEKVLFNSIKKSDFSELTFNERESLFLILADFDGVGNLKLKKEIALFKNMNGEFKPLGEMVAYRENIPSWLSDYVLCKEDDSTNLADYLIPQGNEFESVICENISNIDTSWTELYKTYKEEWTGQFTRNIIDNHGIDNEILTIIEESDTKTKEYFLNNIKKLELNPTSTYKKDSYEYRVLQMALSIFSEPSDFSSKIYFNGQCIKDFSIIDTVNCEYTTSNGENKKISLSLARLLPNYQNQSGLIEKVLNLFETKTGLEKFFDAKPKPTVELYSELNTLLGIPHKMYGPWEPGLGNAQQYLFSVYYRKRYYWSVLKGMQIQLEKESEEFAFELLDILFSNNIDIATSPFTYHLKGYFIDKFFDCDFVFDTECILRTIEKWANDKKKKDYLIRNGVREVSSEAIRFRQFFLENKAYTPLETLSDNDLQSAIAFFAEATGYQRPFAGECQKAVLLKLRESKQCKLISKCNLEGLASISKEWEAEEYKEWITDHYPQIFFFNGDIPMNLLYNGRVLVQFTEGYYYYDTDKRILYVSKDVELESTLFSIAKDGKSSLDLDDYKDLCMSGKISISRDEIETKDKQISTLMIDNQEKDKLLKRYRAKYGSLDDDIEEESNVLDHNVGSFAKGETDTMSKPKQFEAQIEAQRFLMQTMRNWSFPEGYGETDESGKPKQFSTVVVKDESDDSIPIVLKSYKKASESFKINAEEWDWIIQDGADLLIYDGKDIKRHDINDLIRNQTNVSITFSTENLDIEDRISAFSDSLHYFKELHFDFDSFNISQNAQSIINIYKKNKRANYSNNNTEDDI